MLTVVAALTMLRPGDGLGRTMADLQAGRPVSILFYGQSITEQTWTTEVVAGLKKRFPKATLIVDNRAIGGFAADKLIRTLPADLALTHPDLVIFHDYGGEPDYERMVRWMRARSHAEVLLASDHVTWSPDPSLPNAKPPDGDAWHDQHADWIRNLAAKLGCGYVDVRGGWREELRTSGRPASFYLSDGVHLNDAGNALMARLVGEALVPGGSAGAPSPVKAGRSWTGTGAVRVLSASPVTIDGSLSETLATSWVHERSSGASRIPLIKRIGFRTLPTVPEEWTIRLLAVEEKRVRFSLSGSKTGSEGEGWSDADFVSPSGLVTISASDWEVPYVAWVRREFEKGELRVGDEFRWRLRLLDSAVPPGRRELRSKSPMTVWLAGRADALAEGQSEP